MNELKIFENAEFGQVRTVTIENEPWFAGFDVADALGYKNQSDAIAKHVEDEDKQRVQHTVEHSADQHGSHGIAGVAVGTDLIIDHNAHAGKHGAKKINAAVINGIGQHCVSGTKEAQQGNHEDFTDDTEDDST